MARELPKDHEGLERVRVEEGEDLRRPDTKELRENFGRSGIARSTPMSAKKVPRNKTTLAPSLRGTLAPAEFPLLPHCHARESCPKASPCSLQSLETTYDSIIRANISNKFVTTRTIYNSKVINDIMNDEPTHIVSVFKEYLIQDDATEFCREFYSFSDSAKCLKSITLYHSKYSKVFPNYFRLDLKRHMFRNIRRKQKVIDRLNAHSETREQATILNTKFMRELNRSDSVLGKSLREGLVEMVNKVMEESLSFAENLGEGKANDENNPLLVNKGRNYNRLIGKNLKPKMPTEVKAERKLNKPNIKRGKMQILVDAILKADQKNSSKKIVPSTLACNRSKSTDKFVLSPRLQLKTARESAAPKVSFPKKPVAHRPSKIQAIAQLFSRTKYLVQLERSKSGHSKPRQHTASVPKKLEQQGKGAGCRNHNYSKSCGKGRGQHWVG